MKERPILFSDAMVRAILAGTKTQTRRAVRFGFSDWNADHSRVHAVTGADGLPCFIDGPPNAVLRGILSREQGRPCPYGQPGDRLWVRETWSIADGNGRRVVYRADLGTDRWPATVDLPTGRVWRPSVHMKRADSRLTLEVTSVRVERVQSISEEDARAEGLTRHAAGWSAGGDGYDTLTARQAYAELWDEWTANPWVWVVAFEVV